MRQLLTGLCGLVLLGTLVGCTHTCGICDCGTYTPCDGSCCAVSTSLPLGVQATPVETLKVMPQGATKEE